MQNTELVTRATEEVAPTNEKNDIALPFAEIAAAYAAFRVAPRKDYPLVHLPIPEGMTCSDGKPFTTAGLMPMPVELFRDWGARSPVSCAFRMMDESGEPQELVMFTLPENPEVAQIVYEELLKRVANEPYLNASGFLGISERIDAWAVKATISSGKGAKE